MSISRRTGPRALVLVLLLGAALTAAAPAGATIVNLQIGTKVSTTTATITPTLPSASTAGTLLVAVLSNGKTSGAAAFSAPANWVKATSTFQSCCGEVEVWYYANNPGGVSSATFTASTGTSYIAGELSEWNGVLAASPLDQVGTATASAAASLTVPTSASLTASGELGVSIFDSSLTTLTSFTAGTSWAHLFTDTTTTGDVADYSIGLASGAAASSKETAAGGSPSWVGGIATFKAATCSGGSLGVTAPSSTSFSAVTLNGTNQTVTSSIVVTPDDETGSGAGWNVTGTSTTFKNAASKTLPTTATQITAAATSTTGGNCVGPTNSIAYPVTLPAGTTAPTAVKLYNAAATTGKGPIKVTLTTKLTVPANSFNGSYTSTWTLATVSGP